MNYGGRQQVKIESASTDEALPVIQNNNLIPSAYDYIALTYVAAGNGAGEISTITYKTGGSTGTTVATLTLTYNADDKIETVTKT